MYLWMMGGGMDARSHIYEQTNTTPSHVYNSYLLLVHLLRKIVLCRMRLKRGGHGVRDLCFSPDGRHFAVTQERQFQVYMYM